LPKIIFLFDRVMHYHRELFRVLDEALPSNGFDLVLLSGKERESTTGRVALRSKVVRNQSEFKLTERRIGGFMVRHQHEVAKMIRELRPSVVVTMCHSGTLSEWQILALKQRLGFKLIAWQCGYEFNPGRFKKFVLGKFVPHFDHHLAYHTNAKKYAIAHGARPDQVTVMHNTINEEAIACLPKQDARRLVCERWPVLVGKRIVLYVGAVLEEKRLEVVFEAMDMLGRNDLVFLLVGDGPYLNTIKEHFGDRSDFVSTGQIVDGVGPYFDSADVFVLPGTGGLAINEAMAHGLPVISGYADGSADDLVVDNENGFRLYSETAAEMADRIQQILTDPAIAERMGQRSREWITGKFAFREYINRIKSVLLAHT
jgi:glycosyltransferase involved in cell wall biosynthesis